MECRLWPLASKTRKEGPDSAMDDGRKRNPPSVSSVLHFHRPSLWEATKSLSKASFWLGALFFGMYWMGYFLTPEKQRVAQKYHVSQDAVFVAPKPHACDLEDLQDLQADGTANRSFRNGQTMVQVTKSSVGFSEDFLGGDGKAQGAKVQGAGNWPEAVP